MRPLDESPENKYDGGDSDEEMDDSSRRDRSRDGRSKSLNGNSDNDEDNDHGYEDDSYRPRRGRGRGGYGGPPHRRHRDDDYDDYNDYDGYGPPAGFPPRGFPPSRGFPPFRGGPRGRGFPAHRGRGGRRDYDDYGEMGGHWGGPPDGWGGPMGMMGPPPGMGPPPHMMMGGPNGFGYGPPGMGGPMSGSMNMPPPGMMGGSGPPPNMGMPPPNIGMPPPNMPSANPLADLNGEVWVETKSGEGKSYYYNARTRETTWTKPEGANVKIILQEQVEMMASQVIPTSGMPAAGMPPNMASGMPATGMPPNMASGMPGAGIGGVPPNMGAGTMGGSSVPEQQETKMDQSLPSSRDSMHEMAKPAQATSQSNIQIPNSAGTDSAVPTSAANMPQQVPPGGASSGPAAGSGFPPFNPPAFSGPPPFGMPPPSFAQGPWGMPPPMMNNMMGQTVPPGMVAPAVAAAPSISAPAALTKDDTTPQIDPEIVAKAAEWSEHKAPDGRSYFYNAKAGESVWEKPPAMKDLETAKLALAQGISTVSTSSAQPSAVSMATDDASQDAKSSESSDSEDSDDEEAKEAERKRKEEEEEREKKRKEEEEQKAAADRSKPVSSTPVPGTPWCVVWTGDGRVFFYNPSSRTSVWERPEDLVSRSDVDKMLSSPPDNVIVAPPAASSSSTTEKAHKRDNTVAEDSGESPAAKKSKVEPKPQPLPQPQLQQQQQAPTMVANPFAPQPAAAVQSVPPQKEEVKKIDLGKEAAMEAEVRAARERAIVPLETRIASFRAMLQEKDVSAFSTWEKELHKIVFDPRYLLLTSKERKQVFEKYVKERAEEERKEKRNKMKEKKEEYRRLMDEANLHGKSSFSDFSAKFGKDDRFKNIEKMRERESLFNEFIIDVRRKEKEEKMAKREQVRKDFLALLRETSEIDRHSRYSEIKKKIDSDPRYKAVESSSLREDLFRDYIHELKEERRRQKDKEKETKRGDKERKKEEKEKDGDKEKEEEGAARSGDEDEDGGDTTKDELDKEAEKKARQEASIREREKEVQRTLAVHLRDRDNEREQHKRDEAVAGFNALLADLVRNSELNWREAKRQLRKDHRWDSAELLDRDEKEKLFNEHIEELTKKKREKFRELLNETAEVTISSSWKDIRKIIKEDPRYTKFSSSDRRCEREFKDYLKDKTSTAKAEFRELLQETKLISHKSAALLQENETYMSEVESVLRNDKRFLCLDHIPEERTQIILAYLDELEKRGPPPPPTASEPNRRQGNGYMNTFGAYPKPGLSGPDMYDDN